MSVRALVVDPSATDAVRLTEVPEPVPGPGQVLVDVHHVSLNHGDLNDALSGRVPEGAVLGSDAAGVVVRSEGPGPAVGTRVVALSAGAFAERIAVDADALAEIPDGLSPAEAAALPVAGIAALRSLRAGGLAPGKRVLVTGASGGVGRFALQLAAAAGAHVIASVGSASRREGLVKAGADEVVGLKGLDRPVDVIIDSVGGPQMVAAWELLAPGGSLQSVGWTSGEPAVFPPYSTIGPAKSLTSFVNDLSAPAADLALLVGYAAEGSLAVQIGWQGPWERFADAAQALRRRTVQGKAVLRVTATR
ncbi:zinc-binding dehydrogenase [Streptomyces sp. NPDC051098]|uniref:zinc-binding dehydrogenase n=1 Tax=Streptomyces sp. NPDC051098 TaxID=3155411 RepID=UPI0034302627